MRDVDDGPGAPDEQAACFENLLAQGVGVGVVGTGVLLQRLQAGRADLGQTRWIDDQSDDERSVRVHQTGRQRCARHQRHIGRLDAARGQIHAGRRLGRPRHADEDHVGALEIVAGHAIVVGEGVLHGFDAAVVVLVEGIAGAVMKLHGGAGVRGQAADERFEREIARQVEPAATLLERFPDVGMADAVQDVARRSGERAEDLGNLAQAADHLPQAPLDLDTFELCDSIARQHLDQFARGV